MRVEFIPAERPLHFVFGAEDNGGFAAGLLQHVLGVVQFRIRKKRRARHFVRIGEMRGNALLADDAAEIPNRIPEHFKVRD